MEKKQIKMSLGTFIAVIIAIILAVVVIFMGIQLAKQDKQTEQNNTNTVGTAKEESVMENKQNEINKDTVKSLDINSDLVQSLYGYICEKYPAEAYEEGYVGKDSYSPWFNWNGIYTGYYRSEKITNSTLEDDLKLIVTLETLLNDKKYTVTKLESLNEAYDEFGTSSRRMNLEDSYYYNFVTGKYEVQEGKYSDITSDVYTFSMNDIQARAMQMYNTKINIEKHSYDGIAEVFAYDNNTYKYFNIEGGGDYDFFDDSKLLKAEQNNDEIYIYDNYIKVKHMEEPVTVYVTSDEKLKLKVTNVSSEVYPEEIWQLLKQQNVGIPMYKHTFKQANDGTYYWASSELINKNELKIDNN